mmetsp:Transcript_18469/g.42767  ORF Transcript_18469/g.42767 Transcript_18469/m.42767 type:complete len:208 (+) Transcript_18469:221-844(+)
MAHRRRQVRPDAGLHRRPHQRHGQRRPLAGTDLALPRELEGDAGAWGAKEQAPDEGYRLANHIHSVNLGEDIATLQDAVALGGAEGDHPIDDEAFLPVRGRFEDDSDSAGGGLVHTPRTLHGMHPVPHRRPLLRLARVAAAAPEIHPIEPVIHFRLGARPPPPLRPPSAALTVPQTSPVYVNGPLCQAKVVALSPLRLPTFRPAAPQ